MSIKNRPYVGSWEMGTQSVVRYTPDAKVMINGHTELAVCATCGHKTDFNKFITTISVDASTDPVSSCSVTLAVPRHEADVFSHDGNYVLQPGLEVVVLMRGYFPVTGYAMKGQEASESVGDDDVPVYPYYQVFRGVVTEATHEFSGGFYSCSLTCSSILHFWQYLYLSTNGSVFGAKPQDGGGIGIDLTGHRFTGMSPYGIMYTLMRVGFGAAFGVNWTISQATNIAAVDDSTGKSLYKHAALWWEKRWSESSMRFRMYGMDGSLFNAMEQSYLGIFASGQTNASSFLTSFNIDVPDDSNWENTANRAATARAFGYRGAETSGAVLDDEGAKLDAMKMQAYTLDLGRLGQVNFFDGEYMSKMEIANAVKEIIGYEFYQDVDGDIVFKPPFYNLDTSSDEVYCIRDRDLISISESEREPEATYVKGSGSLFQNFRGILSGEFGTREAKFADWRLISQFGWRETSFESHYYSGSKQMFIGAIMRLDVANAEMRSAQITVPMRPELRPGYPVWVEHLDCFFYIKALSHSFSPGAACQTTITGIAKRAKWLPPGFPDRSEGSGSQNLPSLDDVRLDAPGEYPPMPLYVFPEDIDGNDPEASGPPRVMGYPNVVMALDPNKLNPLSMPGGLYFTSGQTYFDTALSLGVLRREPTVPGFEGDEPQYRLAVDNDPVNDIILSRSVVVEAFAAYREAEDGDFGFTESGFTSFEFEALMAAVEAAVKKAIPDADQLNNYMGLQRNLKSVFGGGKNNQGEYRYYSSSSPNPDDQSPSEVLVDLEAGEVNKTDPGGPVDSNFTGLTSLRQEGDRIKVVSTENTAPIRGFRVYGFAPPEEEGDDADSRELGKIDVTTRDIRFVTFQKRTIRIGTPVASPGMNARAALILPDDALRELYREIMLMDAGKQDASASAKDRMGGDTSQDQIGYGRIYNAIKQLAQDLGVASDPTYTESGGDSLGSPVDGSLSDFANAFTAYGTPVWTTGQETYETFIYDSQQAIFLPVPKPGYGPSSYDGTEVDPSYVVGVQNGVHVTTEGWAVFPVTRTRYYRVNNPIELPKDTSQPVGRVDAKTPGLTGMADTAGVNSLADACAVALTNWTTTIQGFWAQEWVSDIVEAVENEEGEEVVGSLGEPTEAEQAAFDAFIETLTEDYSFSVEQGDGTTTVLTTKYEEKGEYSTVLPVSDNRGYEVYGTLAYGRGLSIQSYKSLLEVGGSPSTTESMLAVEAFLAATFETQGGDIPNALEKFDDEQRAKLAAALEAPDSSPDGLEETIARLVASSESESVFVRNTPVTTSSRGQSITFALSAEELADLTVGSTEVCLCKGTEASHWIQAFTGEFVELRGDEAVNEFLISEADLAGQNYSITKQALAGEIMDTGAANKLAQTIKDTGAAFASLGNAAGEAGTTIVTEFQQAASEVRRSFENVGQLAQGESGLTESTGTLEDIQERDDQAAERLNQSVSPPLSYRPFEGEED